MIYRKESSNMLIVAVLMWWFILAVLYGVWQGEAFYDNNDT